MYMVALDLYLYIQHANTGHDILIGKQFFYVMDAGF